MKSECACMCVCRWANYNRKMIAEAKKCFNWMFISNNWSLCVEYITNAAMLLDGLMMVMLHMDPEWLTTRKFVRLFWSCVMLCVYLAVAVVHFASQNSWIHSIHSQFYALAYTIPALCSPIFRIERFYANSFQLRSKFPSLLPVSTPVSDRNMVPHHSAMKMITKCSAKRECVTSFGEKRVQKYWEWNAFLLYTHR